MSQQYLTLDATSVAAIQRELDDREEAITQGVLQQPDYPPLPTCPVCQAAPERIESSTAVLAFTDPCNAVRLRFSPCGHQFRVEVPF